MLCSYLATSLSFTAFSLQYPCIQLYPLHRLCSRGNSRPTLLAFAPLSPRVPVHSASSPDPNRSARHLKPISTTKAEIIISVFAISI